jgi:hypothetical protein
MSLKPMAENKPLQVAQLKCLMQQCDADWDEITGSIQDDKQRLADLQQHLENFRLLLALMQEEPSAGSMMALSGREAALEHQVALLQQSIALKSAQRNSAARQFEQARLALLALCQCPPEKPSAYAVFARKLLTVCIKRPLHGFWSVLHRPEEHCEIIPGDASLWPRW